MLQLSSIQYEYWNKRRLLINPIRCIHNQCTLCCGNVDATPTFFVLQSISHYSFIHKPSDISKRFLINIIGVSTKAEGMINAWSSTSIDLINCWRKRFQGSKVHKCIPDWNGSLIRDLKITKRPRFDHIIAIQIVI